MGVLESVTAKPYRQAHGGAVTGATSRGLRLGSSLPGWPGPAGPLAGGCGSGTGAGAVTA